MGGGCTFHLGEEAQVPVRCCLFAVSPEMLQGWHPGRQAVYVCGGGGARWTELCGGD